MLYYFGNASQSITLAQSCLDLPYTVCEHLEVGLLLF